MSIDEQHVALPKLYGAPAYARPAAPVDNTPRPPDPDDLPIEAYQTDDEREYAASLPARSWTSVGDFPTGNGERSGNGTHATAPDLRPRSFRLRSIAGKLLGGD